MLVGKWMSKKLISIGPMDSISQAKKLLAKHCIEFMPVVDGQKNLLGMVSSNDISQAQLSYPNRMEVHELAYLLSRMQVGDIMKHNPLFLYTYDTIEDAITLMLNTKNASIPVLDEYQKTKAMICQSDILKALVYSQDLNANSSLVALTSPDISKHIKTVIDLLFDLQIRPRAIFYPDSKERNQTGTCYVKINVEDEKKISLLKNKFSLENIQIYFLDKQKDKKQFAGELFSQFEQEKL